MDGKENERIEAFLQLKGMSLGSVSRSRLEQLRRVDRAVTARLLAIEEARAVLAKNKINVAAVAEASGISRKTFYNVPMLQDYIQHLSGKPTRNEERTGGKSRLDDLKSQIEMLVAKDAATEDLKLELAEMGKALDRKDAQIKSLQAANEGLRRNLAEARRRIPPAQGNIIEFRRPTDG